MNASSDIVVTGSGVLTALGVGVRACTDALRAGRTAIESDPTGAMCAYARIEPPYLGCEIPDELESQVKFLNPAGRLAVTAAAEAVGQAGGIDAFEAVVPDRRSLYLAQVDCSEWDCRQVVSGYRAAARGQTGLPDTVRLNKSANRKTKPFFMLEGLKNNAFSFLATWLEIRGPNTAVGGFDLSGFYALDRAVSALRCGVTDVALVVGAAFTTDPLVRREVALLYADDPIALGDGAGALVLERRADAERRGATILATWVGAASRTGPEGGPAPVAEVLAAAAQGGPVGRIVLPEGLSPPPGAEVLAKSLGHLSGAKELVELALGLVGATGPVAVVSVGRLGRAGAVVLRPETTST